MKKWIFLFFAFFIFGLNAKSQDYSIIPTKLNALGTPGSFFLSRATIQNNSSSTIQLFMTRILKDLPPSWTSCFCYPECLAPFIDTLWFTIPAYSSDSIMPNYGTDTIPGLGTIKVVLYQTGFESEKDTIVFTGSTLSVGIEMISNTTIFKIFPNPVSNTLSIQIDKFSPLRFNIYTLSGNLIYSGSSLLNSNTTIDLSFLSDGMYYITGEDLNGEKTSLKFIKY